ncbi:DNA repair-scaffolding protein-like [Protopterus annectens]|uniref:DNA repair-scaffolding protein-like n=1 Tax=Protopterus annectens TaxID=7888 RepID=UPI001CF94648|nr:DNA repair-scaffolding protein-like [Protopterus annectens]
MYFQMLRRRKRKRGSWEADGVNFPDDVPTEFQKDSTTSANTASSLCRAWQRCGEGFQGSSNSKTIESSEEKKVLKLFAPSLLTVEASGSRDETDQESADILWSSSESSISEEEEITKITELPHERYHTTEPQVAIFCKAHPHMFSGISDVQSSNGGSEVIDWENASSPNGSSGPQMESVANPSDANSFGTSSSSEHNVAFPVLESCQNVDDILEYSSDTETSQRKESCAKFNEASSAAHHETELRQSIERPASEWLKSAQELLRTPEKRTAKQFKTPEDSAKKRKKFLRGGLAERLNRLQSRERSAISFWRHQCVSDYRTPEDGKSGVLTLKVLQLQEECSMQVAFCQLLSQSATIGISEDSFSASELNLTVFFTKETSTHLQTTPGDVIHIYPPCRNLNVVPFNEKELFVTIDLVNIFSVIPQGTGLDYLLQVWIDFSIYDTNEINVLCDLIDIVLKNNFVHVEDEYFQQISQVVVSTSCAP